jgi:transposase
MAVCIVYNTGTMYIRKVNKKDQATGEMYPTYRLVEAYRNTRGEPRQQVLLNLGSGFNVAVEDWKSLTDRIDAILSGQVTLFGLSTELESEAQRMASLITKRQALEQVVPVVSNNKSYTAVDLDSLQYHDIRSIGAEYVGYHAACQLGLTEVLLEHKLSDKQINTALASIISRLCAPASEYSTHDYLQNDSALDEVLGTDFSTLPLKNLYKISDVLLEHKESIEQHLYQKEKDLFNLKETITLFDITNTYFEGRSLSNSKAKYGRSKEKRADCKIVALGLVLDASGFPKKSKIFPGNVSEPATLGEMITALDGNKGITIIMDAGIATKDNIEYLKQNGYHYIVVSRSHNLNMPDLPLVTVKQDLGNTVNTALVINEESDEVELYCQSEAKEAKAREIINKATQRYETELTKLTQGLTKDKATKKYDKVLHKLGRLSEKYSSINMLYSITVTPDTDKKNAVAITWTKKENVLHKKETGIYCLKSSRKDLDAKTLWETYTMLTDLESAFRSLKTELGFRPIYHQKEERIDGHLFISILAYHLLHTIRYQLKMHGIHDSWDSLRKLLRRQYRITSNLQLEDGISVNIRKTSAPTAPQIEIYKALGISSLPGKVIKTFI